ncbi:16S rRNA (cytidine(1402)-2'-O)-methyltransferase [Thermodesulfobacteriota bacterium]
MPSNLPTNDPPGAERAGTLYVVATPIGNMDDITLRALRILEKVDRIAAEDTRHTGKLLAHHQIKKRLISYHEHNEEERTAELVQRLKAGESIALVSDAGTPSVSDPGYRLIYEAIAGNIAVIPIPGVSAAITALSVSGLPTDSFTFIGFPPKKRGKRRERLERLSRENRTLVFYESPKRILAFMDEIATIMGDRFAVLGREMTKTYEEIIRGSLSEIRDRLQERPSLKGECTLLVAGPEDGEDDLTETIKEEIKARLGKRGTRLSDVVKELAEKYSLPKRQVYREALKIKRGMQKMNHA